MSTYPTTSLHSFSDVLQKRLTSPFSICLGVGLGAASYHAFANVSSYFYGPVPAINEDKLELKKDVGQAVQVWEWFYENATVSHEKQFARVVRRDTYPLFLPAACNCIFSDWIFGPCWCWFLDSAFLVLDLPSRASKTALGRRCSCFHSIALQCPYQCVLLRSLTTQR